MANPLIPGVVSIVGNSTSVEGDTVRVTVFSGSTARGTTTTVLNSNKEAIVDLANVGGSIQDGDTVVITEIGSAIGGSCATVAGGGVEISLSPTAVAFPSRSL